MKKDKKPTTKQVAPVPALEEKPVQKRARSFKYQAFLIPVLAVLTGLIIGALFIVFTDLKVLPLYKSFFIAPLAALRRAGMLLLPRTGHCSPVRWGACRR